MLRLIGLQSGQNMKFSQLLVAHSILTSAGASAQTSPSIAMGVATISLGESATDAVSSLSRDYTVTTAASQTPKAEEWLISEMGSKLKVPVATLYAQNGKVVGFQVIVEISDAASTQNAFNYFFSLVGKLTEESHNRCTLTRGTNYLNGSLPINKTFVDFTCGPYYFSILKNEYYFKQNDKSVDGCLLVEKIGKTD